MSMVVMPSIHTYTHWRRVQVQVQVSYGDAPLMVRWCSQAFGNSTIDCLQLALSVGSKAAVRHIYGRFGVANLLPALLLFSDHSYIQVLMLLILEFKLCDVIALVKSLPLLSELTTGPPYLGPISINITAKEPPAYVVSKHKPTGKRFRCWHFRKSTRKPITNVVKCALLLALACPNFDNVTIFHIAREKFAELLEKTIDTATYREHASRLRCLLSHVPE
ncbi:hypothetical protein GGI14_005180 [Coemansia sp. S680]|nr:hypothetical protein GGI14_005180 [Coemansia sp. S680]